MQNFTKKSPVKLMLVAAFLGMLYSSAMGQTYRYYRITLNSGNNLELADVRWMNGSNEQPTNQSNGSAVTSSNGGWWNVFDSDRSAGAWIGSATGSQFITIDLGSAVSMSGIKLQLASWSGALTGFTCAGSSNNSSFTNLYTALAINQSGGGAVTYNFGSSDMQAPTVPSSLASSAITASSFSLSWAASTDNVGVTGYEVLRNGTSIGTPTSTSFSLTGLSASTNYSMTVRARDAAGNWSATSSALSVTTSAASDTQTPTIPSALVSSSITSTSFNLTWSASTDNVGVAGYEVFRNGTSIGTPTTTNFSVTGLSASTSYSMTVRARDGAGNWSASSNALSVTTSASGGGGSSAVVNFSSQNNGNLPNPFNDATGYTFTGATSSGSLEALVVQTISGNKAIVNSNWASKVTITRTGGGSFDLSSFTYASSPWGDLADATVTGQLLAGGTVSSNISRSSLTFATTSLNWTNLSQVVIDYSGGTNNSYGLLDDFSFGGSVDDTQSPTVPAGLVSSSITSSSFNLTWSTSTDNVGVTGYEVFRSGISVGTPNSTNLSITGLSASTNYNITVRARDAAGNWSASSSPLSVTTSAAAATPVTGVTLSPTTLSLNVGTNSQLTALVSPSNATNKAVSWTSSNNSVVSVSTSGVVNGVASGNATITVTTQDQNKTATASVTVSSVATPPGNLLDPNATPSVVALWNYLKSIYGTKMLTGAWTEGQYGGNQEVVRCTGKMPAIWANDMNSWYNSRQDPLWNQTWQGNIDGFKTAYNRGQILQVNWHWQGPQYLNNGVYAPGGSGPGMGAWSEMTVQQWNDIVTPGTSLYNKMIEDIDYHVTGFLKKLVDDSGNPLPIIFRPLHEIDGGWFWWTCRSDPSKTATLFKIVQDRIINYHQCHNLIWVYNPGVICDGGSWPPYQTSEYPRRRSFYPGDAYCDITGIDLYDFDPIRRGYYNTNPPKTYRDAWNVMKAIAPDKMIALCEAEAIPDAAKCFNDPTYAPWLYVLPWYAQDTGQCAWNNTQFNSPYVINANDFTQFRAPSGGRLASNETNEAQKVISEEGMSVTTFPNPVRGNNLQLQLDGFSQEKEVAVRVYDISGRAVFSTTVYPNNSYTQRLEVPKEVLISQLYIINVSVPRRTIKMKVVVE